MANIIGEIKTYHDGKVHSIANIYDSALSDPNVKGYLEIYHNGSICYIPLADNQSLKQSPCFEIYHGNSNCFALQIQSAELSAKISSNVTYNSTGTISVIGNKGGGNVTAIIPSAYSDCLSVQSTTTNTVVVKCTKYTSSKIPVTVNVAAAGNYTSGTTTVNVTTSKATTSPSVTLSDSITYNTSKTVPISGNTDSGSVSVDIPDVYSECLTTTSISADSVTFKCTKYIADTIPVSINIAATSNYAAASVSLNVKTARASISPSATVSGTITYNSSGTISISGNSGGGNVTLSVTSANYDYLDFSNITTDSATVTCTNYKSYAIPVTVKIAAAGNYNSGTCTVNVTTSKANISPSASLPAPITYNTIGFVSISGNPGKGGVSATIPDSYSDCLVTYAGSTYDTLNLKCKKYTPDTIPITVKVLSSNNYNGAIFPFNVTTAKADISPVATTSDSITYNSSGTISISGNKGGGNVSAIIPSAYSDCLSVQSTTTNTVVVKCTKYTADSIPVTVNVAASNNYNSATYTVNVTTSKADISPAATISDSIAYNSSGTISISGNLGNGAVTAIVPSDYSDYLSVQSTTTSTAILKCTKYTSDSIPVTVNIAASSNYNSGTCTVNVSTSKANISTSSVVRSITYNFAIGIAVTNNLGKGAVSVDIPSDYSDCLTTTSISTSTVTFKCTKYTPDTISVPINIAETDNYNSGTYTTKFITSKANISPTASISGSVTYNSTKTANIGGNLGKGAVSVDIPSDYSDCLTTTSISTSTVTFKCTKYTADTIPVTVSIAATNNYNSKTFKINVTTAKANISPTASISGAITYGDTKNISVSGNNGGGDVIAIVPDSYWDYLTAQSSSSDTVTFECTQYTADSIPVTVNVLESDNYNSGTCKVNVTTSKANISPSASISGSVAYNSTKNISISGNFGEGSVTVDIPDIYSDCLTTTSISADSVTVKCTQYTADSIPVTINVAESSNYNSATYTVNVTTSKANISLSTSISGAVTYNSTKTATISGNLGNGAVSAIVPSAYSDYLSVQSTTTSTVTFKCTKYTSDSIPVTVNITETSNYNSGTKTVNVTTAKADNTLTFDLPSPIVLTYGQPFTITATQNLSGGTLSIGDTGSGSVAFKSHISASVSGNSITLTCTNWESSYDATSGSYTIVGVVTSAETSNYKSTSVRCGFKLRKAEGTLSASVSGTVTYGETKSATITGNNGGGTVTVIVPDAYSDCLTVSDITTATFKVSCTKYAPATIPLTVNVAASNNYSSGTCTVNVTTSRKKLSAAQSTFSASSINYDGSAKSVVNYLSGYNSNYHTLSGDTSATDVSPSTYTVKIAPKSNFAFSDGSTSAKSLNWNLIPIRLTKPSLSDSSFTFDKSSHSPTINNFNSNYESQSGVTSATNAGTYTVTFSLLNSVNTTWNDSTTSNVKCTWSISSRLLAIPTLTNTTYTFDKKSHSPTVHDYNSTYENQSGMISAVSADTYHLTYSLKNTSNTTWTDGSTSSVTRDWQIDKRKLPQPYLSNTTYTFDTSSHSPTIIDYDSNYENQSGTDTATNVGTYSLTYSLKNTSDTIWTDNSVASVTRTWQIKKLLLLVPTLSNTTYTFDGNSHSPTVNNFNSTYETQKGTDAATNANTYHLTYSLKDKDNTIWNGLNTNDFVRDWVINPASTGKTPYIMTGDSSSPLKPYTYSPNTQREPSIYNYDSDTMSINSNSVLKATNAGTYSITFETKSNYVLPNGDKFISRDWVINPISINEAGLSATHLTYDGNQKSVSLVFPADYYSLVSKGGVLSATNAGAYTYTVDFKDHTNYIWTTSKNSKQLNLVWYIDKVDSAPSFSVAANDESSGTYQATVFYRYANTNPTVFTDTSFELVSWSVKFVDNGSVHKTWSSTDAGIIQTNIYNAKFRVDWSPNGHSYADLTINAYHGGLVNDANIFQVQVNLRCTNPNFSQNNEWSVYRVFTIRGQNYGGPDVTISNS